LSLKLADRWIWDSWYVQDGDTYHAFYLCASRGLGDPNRRHRNPSVGHAISKDLKNWTVVADALTPSDGPAFDSWTTWTGSVTKDDDGNWWMFYTGSSREDGGLTQRVGAATSKDLISWTKLGTDPVVEADGAWYEKLDLTAWGDEAWRDPWVFRFPGDKTWQMLITARAKDGEPSTRAVVGHATSENLVDWSVQPPLSKPGQGFGQYEVFQFEHVDGVPILLFCCGWRELGQNNLERFGKIDATYSMVVNDDLSNLDFTKALPFTQNLVYAGRLIQGPDQKWYLMGFVNEVDGKFVGELSDPIPVTADPVLGIVPR
jgi:beta-fructofuranosidase